VQTLLEAFLSIFIKLAHNTIYKQVLNQLIEKLLIDNPNIPNVTAGMNITVKAPNTITAINTIFSGGKGLYQAPTVILNLSFKAENGSVFVVQNGNCNN
jgi:hypothetical protein